MGRSMYFLKLNIMSLLYAVFYWIEVELVMNIYRWSRITGWSVATINTSVNIVNVVLFIGGAVGFLLLTRNYLRISKMNYFTALLWFPYWVVLIKLFSLLFPITATAERLSPVYGMMIMVLSMLYPVFIVLVTLFGNVMRTSKGLEVE